MDNQLRQSAFDFHEFPVPGKIQVSSTKPLATQRDLALAYPPDIAAPCLEVEEGSLKAYEYTAHGNLVAVIFSGMVVLGLNNIDALAGKPAVGGKDVLLKKFAGIDVLDAEVDELDPGEFIEVVVALEPTFGGANLEDIRAPERFYIEQRLHERMNIPVFRDNQHGVVIVGTVTVLSGLRAVKKNISDARVAVLGVSAAAIACMNLLVAPGLQEHNIVVCDSRGVTYQGRESNIAETRAVYAVMDDGKYILNDVTGGADIFLGYSDPKMLTQEMAKKTAYTPVTLVLANPEPEILSPLAKEVYPSVIIYTGRSDYPNQVNNVPYFPFTFRDVLGVGVTAINEEMKLVAVYAVVKLAHVEQSEVVVSAHNDQDLGFGPKYIIPRPFDPCLIVKIAPAVAKAAAESGVATYPVADLDVYTNKLTESVYKADLFMKPIFSQVRKAPKRVVPPKGEEARILCATQELVTLGSVRLILTGRPNVIGMHIQKLSLQIKAGVGFEIANNEPDPRSKEYWTEYLQIMKCRGTTQEQAQWAPISSLTVIGAIMAQRGGVGVMICGTVGDYHEHLSMAKDAFGYRDGVHIAGVMNALLLPSSNTFTADIYVNDEPDVEELAEVTLMVAETVRRFGIEPCAALLSHSNFGLSDCPSSNKTRQALELARDCAPDLMIDGEIHDDAALVEVTRNDRMPGSPLKDSANILVMLSTKVIHISYNLLRISSSKGMTVGPVLMGVAEPVHVLTPIVLVRHIANVAALAVAEA